MNSTKGDSERGYYFEQHAQAVETGAAFADRRNGSSHHPSISKSFSLLLGLFFGFMIVVVTRQQFQIYTMQKELDDLLRMEDLPYRQDEMVSTLRSPSLKEGCLGGGRVEGVLGRICWIYFNEGCFEDVLCA